METSACGECWLKRKIVVFDIGVYLRAKTPIPGLTKYQQALIRPTLSTIISIPIFDGVQAAPGDLPADNSLIGILNFDSDDATVAQFEAAQDAALKAAVACAAILQAQLSR
jgi:hypothetical protein